MLLLDNGSVFTPQLGDFLASVGKDFERVTPASLKVSAIPEYDSYILSGRTKNDAHTNALNSKIIKHAVSARKPLLGICYGAEMLALTLGGSIRKMDNTHRGAETIKITQDNPLCGGTISVFESHTYEIARLGSLVCVGRSDRCRNELVRLSGMDVYGTQFHPEMTDDGRTMIERFISL